ncbi:MAG TPA: hypothetical protein VKY80_04250 [Croceibacterium sp.]|jgi:hypothetical protein|nr:hypothetical protein [Croceibacterium sp.]
MRRLVLIAGTALALAGCERELTPEEQALADERDIALVQKANSSIPPMVPVTPEPLLLPDIERFDMLGEACSYAPGTSLGARVIARQADAFMKIDGKIERFAADPGAPELPAHTRSVYHSKNYSLRLELREDAASEEAGPDGPAEDARSDGQRYYEGSVTLRDPHGRIVYEGAGLAQCKG